jgi:addiction module HigA family antidote
MSMRLKSRTTTKTRTTVGRRRHWRALVGRRLPRQRPPTRPGEMLLEEFLKPLGVTQSELAARLGVSFPRLNEIVRGKRAITSDTALRLARVLGMSADFWLGLQFDWDLWHAMRGAKASEIDRLAPLRTSA